MQNLLNSAIVRKEYDAVEALLADHAVPINVAFKGTQLPLTLLFQSKDSRMARLFLDCPRVDWIANKCDRNLASANVEREDSLDQAQSESAFDYFYHVSKGFAKACPEDTKIIYERIIEDVVKLAGPENCDRLLFRTTKTIFALKAALKHCTDINVKDELGQTVIFKTKNYNLIRFLVEEGADLNDTDDEGLTPVMHHCRNGNYSIAKYLIKHGADKDFVNAKGQSMFTVSKSKIEFMKHFDLPEKLFVSELTQGRNFTAAELEEVFAKYPEFEAIFKSNLDAHFPAIIDWPHSKRFTDLLPEREDFIFCLNETVLKNDRCVPDFISKVKLSSEEANTLLFHAAKTDRLDLVQELTKKKAQPHLDYPEGNVLFVARQKTLAYFLTLGVDPFFKCNRGLFFYEREDFLTGDVVIDWSWLVLLHRKGFDLFDSETATGKCLIDCFNPGAKLAIEVGSSSFKFPVCKVNELFFDTLLSSSFSALTRIDDDGNCALHHLDDVSSVVIDSSLKKVKRLELIVKKDKHFALGRQLKGADLAAYFAQYNDVNGKDWMKAFGGQLLWLALEGKHVDLVKLLLTEVSLDRVIGGKTIRERILAKRDWSQEIYLLLLGAGLQIDTLTFRHLLRSPFHDVVQVFIQKCVNLEPFIEYFCKNLYCAELMDFLMHERVRTSVAEGSQNGCTVLDKFYFRLCTNGTNTELLHDLGVDARKLLGSGLQAVKPQHFMFWRQSYWKRFLKYGWTFEDFKRLGLFDLFKGKSRFFKRIFTQNLVTAFENMCLDDVVGDRDSCSVCQEEFRGADRIKVLACKHIFHFDCVEEFLQQQRHCPYCRRAID